jgi:hypothetical protein
MSSLLPPTTRSPRFTWVSDGKPFRRLLLTSKAMGFEVFFLDSHGAPLRMPLRLNVAAMAVAP